MEHLASYGVGWGNTVIHTHIHTYTQTHMNAHAWEQRNLRHGWVIVNKRTGALWVYGYSHLNVL